MGEEKEVEPYYKARAKETVDMLYDKGFLSDDLARESIDWLENYVGFLFQALCETSIRASELKKKARECEARPNRSKE